MPAAISQNVGQRVLRTLTSMRMSMFMPNMLIAWRQGTSPMRFDVPAQRTEAARGLPASGR